MVRLYYLISLSYLQMYMFAMNVWTDLHFPTIAGSVIIRPWLLVKLKIHWAHKVVTCVQARRSIG